MSNREHKIYALKSAKATTAIFLCALGAIIALLVLDDHIDIPSDAAIAGIGLLGMTYYFTHFIMERASLTYFKSIPTFKRAMAPVGQWQYVRNEMTWEISSSDGENAFYLRKMSAICRTARATIFEDFFITDGEIPTCDDYETSPGIKVTTVRRLSDRDFVAIMSLANQLFVNDRLDILIKRRIRNGFTDPNEEWVRYWIGPYHTGDMSLTVLIPVERVLVEAWLEVYKTDDRPEMVGDMIERRSLEITLSDFENDGKRWLKIFENLFDNDYDRNTMIYIKWRWEK